jgi:hypothetical protein
MSQQPGRRPAPKLRSAPVPVDIRYPLAGLLVCAGCDLPLHPVVVGHGHRCYRSPCGCRISPVDAEVTERLTYDRLRQDRLVLVSVPTEDWPALFHHLLATVRIGTVPEELALLTRT